MTTIFAHRGFHQQYPENSMAAFRAAISLGAQGIETDVHLSKDHVPVIFHDESLKRMTGYMGELKDLTLSELKKLRLNSTEQIPTLAEFLKYLQDVDFKGVLNLEFKTDRIHYPEIEKLTLEVIQQYKADYQLIFSSFDSDTIIKLHEMTDVECAFLYKFGDKTANHLYKNGVIKSIHPLYSPFIKKSSVPIRPWTVNKIYQMNRCLRLDLAGFFTDNLQVAIQLQKKYERESKF